MGVDKTMGKIRVLAASWRPDILQEIRNCLAGGRADIELVGGAYDRNQAARRATELRADVVLVEFSQPGVGGAGTARMLQELPARPKVIAFAARSDHETAIEVLKSGADGFLLGKDFKRGLARAVMAVHADLTHLGPEAAAALLDEFKTESRTPLIPDDTPPLSRRETQIVMMVAEGLTNDEMAERLEISERTVNIHRSNLRKKLGKPSPAWLTRYAIERGLLKW